TYFSEPLILYGAAMHGYVLTKNVVIANFQTRGLAFVLFILAIFTNRGELKDLITFTDDRWPFNHSMRPNNGIIADRDTRPNNAIWAHLYVAAKLCCFIDEGCSMYHYY